MSIDEFIDESVDFEKVLKNPFFLPESYFRFKKDEVYEVSPYNFMIHDFKEFYEGGGDYDDLKSYVGETANIVKRGGVQNKFFLFREGYVFSMLSLPYEDYDGFGNSNMFLSAVADSLDYAFKVKKGLLLKKDSNYGFSEVY